MALNEQPEGGADVSSGAENTKKGPGKKLLIGIIAVVAAVIIGFTAANSLSSDEKAQVEQVTASIDAIGTVNRNSGDEIESAREDYDALSSKCKRHVKNAKVLTSAEKEYDQLRADEAIKRIAKLEKITVDSGEDITAAKNVYKQLSDSQKALVTNADLLKTADGKYDDARVKEVSDAISAIGEVTLDSKDAIKKAEKLYKALPVKIQANVSNASDLENASAEYGQLALKDTEEKIDKIGKVTLESESAIKDADAAYDALSGDQKKQVGNADVLQTAKASLDQLKKDEADKKITLKKGEVVTTSNWELTFKRSDITTEIDPDNTSGYYLYYHPSDDDAFIDLVFKIKNTGSEMQRISDIVSDSSIQYGEQTLSKDPNLYFSNGSSIDKVYEWDGLDALESGTLHIAFDLPKEVMSDKKTVIVRITLDGVEKRVVVRK